MQPAQIAQKITQQNTKNRTESLNEEVMSGMGSPSVKVAGESTPNGIVDSNGAIRVAPSAKSEAVQGRTPSKGRRLPNCLSYLKSLSVDIFLYFFTRAERLF
jgi:hypothetical protein